MKYLIEHNFTLKHPFYILIPSLVHYTKLSFLKKLTTGTGKINKNFFRPREFDGNEFCFVMTGIFDKNYNINKRRLKSYKKMKLPHHTFHANYSCPPAQFKETYLNLSEDDERTQKALKAHIDAVSELKRTKEDVIMVIHGGRTKENQQRAIDNVVLNLEKALPYAERNGIILAIENMTAEDKEGHYYIGADYDDLKQILRKLPSNNLKVTFDWGHANTYYKKYIEKNFGKKYTELGEEVLSFKHIDDLIDNLKQDIIYGHIHYNESHLYFPYHIYGCSLDEHRPLTDIPLKEINNFSRTIRKLLEETQIKNYGYIHLELWPRTYFEFYTVAKKGSSQSEQLRSLKLFKNLFHKYERVDKNEI